MITDKKSAYSILEGKANGMEETCIGLHHGRFDLKAEDLEYIEESCEEMLEAVKWLRARLRCSR